MCLEGIAGHGGAAMLDRRAAAHGCAATRRTPLRPAGPEGDARASTRLPHRRRLASAAPDAKAATRPSVAQPRRERRLLRSPLDTRRDARPVRGPQPRVPPIRAYGQGQSVHPPRLRAVAGTPAISWRRWSERSVTFSGPAASWSSVASCVDVTGRGWRAAITSSTACWRAVRWLAESRGREVLDGPPEAATRPGRAL
jgi:hypothetical protein